MSIDLDKNKAHILGVYNDVLDDKTTTDWALFGYEGQTNVLKVVGSGDEGFDEMAEDLNANKIMYGVLRVSDPKTSRTKIVLLNWQGEGAPNLQKGVCARHLPEVKKMLKGVHITISARTEEDADINNILNAVAKATSTDYNFKDRSELPDKNVPVKKLVSQFRSGETFGAVGTNYKRTNPQSEIDANRRNKFWEEQETEERIRKEQEMKRREEEAKNLEKERMEREMKDSKHREEINKERNARIVEEKKAESVAMERCNSRTDPLKWEKEVQTQQTEEVERARRADQMRLERKKEAESLIGHKTHQTRSMFESHGSQNNSYSNQSEIRNKPPPRVLKEFSPQVENNSPFNKGNHTPKKSVGARWPPPTEESSPQTPVTVPGKIAEWRPQEERTPPRFASQPTNTTQTVAERSIHQTSISEVIETTRTSYIHNNSHQQLTNTRSGTTHYLPSANAVPVLPTLPFQASLKVSTPPTTPTSPTSSFVASTSPIAATSPPISSLSPTSPASPTSYTLHTLNGVDHKKEDSANQYANDADYYGTDLAQYEHENGDEVDSICMTYEVDGVEYQILPEHGLCARALYDYQAADETEITFDPGDIITNIDQIDVGWWQGVSSLGIFGLFPANYVELINGTKMH